MKLWRTLRSRLGSYRPVTCEYEGHFGAPDSGLPPEFRCIYCGELGYAQQWFTDDAEGYESCECDYDYKGHMRWCKGRGRG